MTIIEEMREAIKRYPGLHNYDITRWAAALEQSGALVPVKAGELDSIVGCCFAEHQYALLENGDIISLANGIGDIPPSSTALPVRLVPIADTLLSVDNYVGAGRRCVMHDWKYSGAGREIEVAPGVFFNTRELADLCHLRNVEIARLAARAEEAERRLAAVVDRLKALRGDVPDECSFKYSHEGPSSRKFQDDKARYALLSRAIAIAEGHDDE